LLLPAHDEDHLAQAWTVTQAADRLAMSEAFRVCTDGDAGASPHGCEKIAG
jgi:hypothetical protein